MKGTYTLLLTCKNSFRRRIGRQGLVEIGEGHYLYTGSALGQGAVSLEGRLARHRRVSKKIRWHVDYLTSRAECRVSAAVCVISPKRVECSIAQAVFSELKVRPVFARAGASDCACESHLVKVVSTMNEIAVRDALTRVYSRFGQPELF